MVDFGKCQLLKLPYYGEQCLVVDNRFMVHPEQKDHGTAHQFCLKAPFNQCRQLTEKFTHWCKWQQQEGFLKVTGTTEFFILLYPLSYSSTFHLMMKENMVFQKKVMRRIYWQKEYNRNAKNYTFTVYSSADTVCMTKSRRMWWVWHVTCKTEIQNPQNILIEKSEGQDYLVMHQSKNGGCFYQVMPKCHIIKVKHLSIRWKWLVHFPLRLLLIQPRKAHGSQHTGGAWVKLRTTS